MIQKLKFWGLRMLQDDSVDNEYKRGQLRTYLTEADVQLYETGIGNVGNSQS